MFDHPKSGINNFLSFIKGKKIILIFSVVIFLLLGFLLTIIKPLEYSSKVSVLIIQKINPNLDAYTAARAAEKLGKNLSSVIYTTSFFDKVRHSNFDLKFNLPTSERQRRQAWQRKISTSINPDTSILEITAYDKDKKEAEKLAQVIAYVLATEGQEYHGGGDDIVIKPVNTALTSNYPTRPNLLVNIGGGLILGFVFGILIIFWQFNKKFNK